MHSHILLEIGKKIRKVRLDKDMIIQDLAEKAGVSKGLISRIENGRTIPSVPVLISLIKSLGAELHLFFDGVDEDSPNGKITLRKASELLPQTKENAVGYFYHEMFNRTIGDAVMQTSIAHIHPSSKHERVTTDGFIFQYMLEGETLYHIGGEVLDFQQGDCIYFDGRLPHVAMNKTDKIAKMLVVNLQQPS